VRVNTADATSNSRIVKVFIDYNNNGTFETSELAATSNVHCLPHQLYSMEHYHAFYLTIGNIYLMRIVVQETSLLLM
jgi:hypothetical protein